LGFVLQNPDFKAVIQKQASPNLILNALERAEAASSPVSSSTINVDVK
jgi:hypothetical protein